jgi:hypothetical protein
VFDGGERGQDPFEGGQQRIVDADDLVLGVVGDPGDLLGVQPDVQRVQHRAHARHREVQLEVAPGVPGERPHPVARPHADGAQRVGETGAPLSEVRVRLAVHALGRPGRDAAAREVRRRPFQQPGEDEGIVLHEAAHGCLLEDE